MLLLLLAAAVWPEWVGSVGWQLEAGRPSVAAALSAWGEFWSTLCLGMCVNWCVCVWPPGSVLCLVLGWMCLCLSVMLAATSSLAFAAPLAVRLACCFSSRQYETKLC